MTNNKMIIDAIRNVAATALAYSTTLLPELLPDGKRQGPEWLSRNPTRVDRNAGSFSVSLKKGKWHDFATGDKGGDLVSLAAYLWRTSQAEAAQSLARRLGLHIEVWEGYPANPEATALQRTRQAQAIPAIEHPNENEALAKERAQQTAANTAQTWFHNGRQADSLHPYLARKLVKPYNLRQRGDDLLIPLYLHNELVNIQSVQPDGSKRFLPGGRAKGCYSLIGQIESGRDLYICEGWATGATIHESTGMAVVCAMSASNLLEVGLWIQECYFDIRLIIAGDDDRQTKGNPGTTAAAKAASALNCYMVLPTFPANAPMSLTDFNDLACWRAQA